MSNLSTLPKGDSAWLLRRAIERIMQQVSVLETNIGSSTTGNSADTQIIFNDAGTLRGDTGLVFNKTTDALTVAGLVTAGSATITGALTVDTTTLVVNAAGYTDRVGIGTASPSYDLEVAGSVRSNIAIRGNFAGGTDIAHLRFVNANGSIVGDIFSQNTNGGASDTAYLSFQTASSGTLAERYRIAGDGVATWSNVGGVAGTAMTLNSTGLGIGVSPSAKLSVAGGNIRLDNNQGLEWGGGNNYIYGNETTDFVAIVTNGVEALRINSSQNIGVGVTPSAWGSFYKVVQVGQAGSVYGRANLGYYGTKFNLYNDNTNDVAITSNFVGEYRFELLNGSHVWLNKSTTGTINVAQTLTQAMTLDASGNLLVGKTSSGSTVIGGQISSTGIGIFNVSADQALICNRSTSVGDIVVFRYSNAQVGSVSVTASATTYNTSSDYRLKESVKPLNGGLARVNALKPSIYNWKSDGSTGEGFLAHELAEVVPAAVTGEKDAVNADGTIKSQGIDMSRIVPILVAAIQELTAEVNALKNA